MLKVITATSETQGLRDNDFCFVPEGELVRLGYVCNKGHGNNDSTCGCDRSLSGFENKKPTTTMKVVCLDITRKQYIAKYAASVNTKGLNIRSSIIKREATFMLNAASLFPDGSILEFRSGRFSTRR